MQGWMPRAGFALWSQHSLASLSAPRGAVLRQIFRGIHPFGGAALAADTEDVSVAHLAQGRLCLAVHGIQFFLTHVYPTTSKTEKFLVRDTLPTASRVPQPQGGRSSGGRISHTRPVKHLL